MSLASYYAAYPYMLGPVYMKLGNPQIGEVTCGGSPNLSCKRHQIKMRDYMGRWVTPPKWVTSPTWGPPCKQALRGTQVTNIKQDKVSKENVVQPNSAATTKIENSKKQIKYTMAKKKKKPTMSQKKGGLELTSAIFPLLAQLHMRKCLYTLSLKCTYLP